VLDVGCGSGVLAIAAARLGAAEAVGIDVDPAGATATSANAIRNELAARVTALATPLHELPGSYDAIVANIGLEVLVSMAPDLEARLAPGGWLALSGISPAQESRLMAAFGQLRAVETAQLDDWLAIVATG
jgi:ribosomal protein L11 methyltransferase